MFNRVSLRSGSSASWTRTGSLVFPDDPSHAFARLSDPGRTDKTSPFAVLTILPPAPQYRRLQRNEHFGAQPRALASAAYASRGTSPPPRKARFRPAGYAFAGRVSNPLDRYERFQLTFILLSRTLHDAMRPAPESRSRGADPHLSRSSTTVLATSFQLSLQHTDRQHHRPSASLRRRQTE